MSPEVRKENPTINIAIFASGAGSNARSIIEYFKDHKSIRVGLIVCNKAGAGVLNHAKHYNIPVLLINREHFYNHDAYLAELRSANINFIVLAGFLWKVPDVLVKAYPGLIVNIHPALLPKYGGKGMFGLHVHEAVITSGDKVSGITIHVVDEKYDNGDIVFQTTCDVYPNDTPESLASRIHELEHRHFAPVIEQYLERLKTCQ